MLRLFAAGKEVFMNRKFRLSTALDIDDLLMECIPYAIRLANEKYKFDPPLSIHEKKQWGKQNDRSDVVYEFFNDAEFYRTQPVLPGAKEFLDALRELGQVVIISDTFTQFAKPLMKKLGWPTLFCNSPNIFICNNYL